MKIFFDRLSWDAKEVHTFHCLHKDLLFFTGVLLIHENAVENAAKRACQRQKTEFYLKEKRARETETEPEASDPNVNSLAGPLRLADLRRKMDRP